jgi:peroxiredoxin Q/BCP
MRLKKGVKAPNFELQDQDGNLHKLSDYIGNWILLYFYPRDNTPGCTKEACSFRDNYYQLKKKITILGVSSNSVKSHKNFSDKYSLPFTLLSDSKREVINQYKTDGLVFPKRTSFLINPKGEIKKIYEKVDPSTHVEEIMKDLSIN